MADEPMATPISEAAQIAIAFFTGCGCEAAEVRGVLEAIYEVVEGRKPVDANAPAPAVPVEQSIGDDFLVCLEDGERLTMLTRYLRTQHNMTPEEYRAKWGLPPDYPMVAPSYSRRRSQLAKDQGLGRKPAAPRKRRAAGQR